MEDITDYKLLYQTEFSIFFALFSKLIIFGYNIKESESRNIVGMLAIKIYHHHSPHAAWEQ